MGDQLTIFGRHTTSLP